VNKKKQIAIISLSIFFLNACSNNTPHPQFISGNYYITGDDYCVKSVIETNKKISCYDKENNLTGQRNSISFEQATATTKTKEKRKEFLIEMNKIALEQKQKNQEERQKAIKISQESAQRTEEKNKAYRNSPEGKAYLAKKEKMRQQAAMMQQAQRQAQYNADMQTINQINQMNQNQQMMNNNLLMQNMSSQPYVQPINPSSNNIIHCIGTAPNLAVCR